MDHSGDPAAPASALQLTVALLLAGVAFGLVAGIAYASMFLFALFEAVGVPVTACLGAILAVKTQQAAILAVSSWRPGLPRLLLASVPAAAIVLGLRSGLHWSSQLHYSLAVAVGLVAQALVLRYLSEPAASLRGGYAAEEARSETRAAWWAR